MTHRSTLHALAWRLQAYMEGRVGSPDLVRKTELGRV